MGNPAPETREMPHVIDEQGKQAGSEDAQPRRRARRRPGDGRDGGQARQRDERAAVDRAQSARRPYPAPRTVSIRRWWPEGSSALRRRRMCTSTVRSSMKT